MQVRQVAFHALFIASLTGALVACAAPGAGGESFIKSAEYDDVMSADEQIAALARVVAPDEAGACVSSQEAFLEGEGACLRFAETARGDVLVLLRLEMGDAASPIHPLDGDVAGRSDALALPFLGFVAEPIAIALGKALATTVIGVTILAALDELVDLDGALSEIATDESGIVQQMGDGVDRALDRDSARADTNADEQGACEGIYGRELGVQHDRWFILDGRAYDGVMVVDRIAGCVDQEGLLTNSSKLSPISEAGQDRIHIGTRHPIMVTIETLFSSRTGLVFEKTNLFGDVYGDPHTVEPGWSSGMILWPDDLYLRIRSADSAHIRFVEFIRD